MILDYSLLLYGSMGGLASVLLATVIRPFYPAGVTSAHIAAKLTWRETGYAAGHLFAGAGIAALYALSWGFAAIVEMPWWLRGLTFGAACWAVLIAPLLVTTALSRSMRRRDAYVQAFEWACTCGFAATAVARVWAI